MNRRKWRSNDEWRRLLFDYSPVFISDSQFYRIVSGFFCGWNWNGQTPELIRLEMQSPVLPPFSRKFRLKGERKEIFRNEIVPDGYCQRDCFAFGSYFAGMPDGAEETECFRGLVRSRFESLFQLESIDPYASFRMKSAEADVCGLTVLLRRNDRVIAFPFRRQLERLTLQPAPFERDDREI